MSRNRRWWGWGVGGWGVGGKNYRHRHFYMLFRRLVREWSKAHVVKQLKQFSDQTSLLVVVAVVVVVVMVVVVVVVIMMMWW